LQKRGRGSERLAPFSEKREEEHSSMKEVLLLGMKRVLRGEKRKGNRQEEGGTGDIVETSNLTGPKGGKVRRGKEADFPEA